MSAGPLAHSSGTPAVSPRLLDLHQAAAYLSLSYWSVRDYVLAGLIPIVDLLPLRPREGERPRKTLRRVLVDRADLDAFIEARKSGCTRDRVPQTEARDTRGNRMAGPAVCPPRERQNA